MHGLKTSWGLGSTSPSQSGFLHETSMDCHRASLLWSDSLFPSGFHCIEDKLESGGSSYMETCGRSFMQDRFFLPLVFVDRDKQDDDLLHLSSLELVQLWTVLHDTFAMVAHFRFGLTVPG